MKKVFGFALVFGLCLFLACSKPANENDQASKNAEWHEKTVTIDLNQCQNVNFGNDRLRLCLDSVNDSRCPMNADCIWAGTAIAKFTFTKNGQANPVTLAIPAFASYPQQITVAGYTIKLINVFPYPDLNANIPPAIIQAKVEIKNY